MSMRFGYLTQSMASLVRSFQCMRIPLWNIVARFRLSSSSRMRSACTSAPGYRSSARAAGLYAQVKNGVAAVGRQISSRQSREMEIQRPTERVAILDERDFELKPDPEVHAHQMKLFVFPTCSATDYSAR